MSDEDLQEIPLEKRLRVNIEWASHGGWYDAGRGYHKDYRTERVPLDSLKGLIDSERITSQSGIHFGTIPVKVVDKAANIYTGELGYELTFKPLDDVTLLITKKIIVSVDGLNNDKHHQGKKLAQNDIAALYRLRFTGWTMPSEVLQCGGP